MKKIVSTLAVVCVALGFSSCDDLFEPAQENNLGIDYMEVNPQYAEGILANGYTRIPIGSYPFSEVATDDAVSNDNDNSWRRIAGGTWRADNNPTERYQNCRAAIQYLNLFLSRAERVQWNVDETLNKMFCDREVGEAYALRAMYMYYLLEAHAGYADDGVLYGVPIVTEPQDQSSDFNQPRNTYVDCVAAMRADAAKALELLPLKYGDADEMTRLQSRYPGASASAVNRVFGINFIGRIDGHIVEAFLAKLDLLSASPRFADNSGVTWTDAAKSCAKVLDRIGGVSGVDPTGNTWYENRKDITNLEMKSLPLEMLWIGERGEGNDLEKDNFPPTLYGNGRINPTQNLVDAFPMVDGYPIKESKMYDDQMPYSNRDPRLAMYIVYNGQNCGLQGTRIITAADGTDNNAMDKLQGKSTRTGYYLRKLLRQDVNLDPSASTNQQHYTPRIRYTEIFLAYAEAANEAYGPSTAGPGGYSAYDVIKAIRTRAGLAAMGGDKYLESIKNDQGKMRELIRNERRIELCFEGHRFWDLRRWKADLNEPAMGMEITGSTFKPVQVETRNYKDYMYYGPLPYSEVLKFPGIQQNKGW